MRKNFNSIIDDMSETEKNDIELKTNILRSYCQKDVNLAKLIEIIYDSHDVEYYIEHYMAKAMRKFLDEIHCVYSNANRNTNRCNLIEEILEFIDSYIYTDMTDINNANFTYNYFGVKITVDGDTINFETDMAAAKKS